MLWENILPRFGFQVSAPWGREVPRQLWIRGSKGLNGDGWVKDVIGTKGGRGYESAAGRMMEDANRILTLDSRVWIWDWGCRGRTRVVMVLGW